MKQGTIPDHSPVVQRWRSEQARGIRNIWTDDTTGHDGEQSTSGLRSADTWLLALVGVVPMFCFLELTNYFYAIMALFAVWAYGDARHTSALIGLALAGTVVFLHLQWRALAYVANSGLGFLAYFLLCALLAARTPAAAADDVSYRPGPS